MNDNFNIGKLIVILIPPLICLKLINDGVLLYSLFCFIPWIFLFCHICYKTSNAFEFDVVNNGNGNYYPHFYVNWQEKIEEENNKLIANVSKKCQLKKNIENMENVPIETKMYNTTTSLLPIKEIVAKELEKKEENKIIDATKQNKLSVDVNKLNTNTQQTQTNINTSSTSKEAILIENDSVLSNNKLGVYKTIIEVLEKQVLLSDKKYALYQSFAHIDALKEGIIIYIDYGILNKAHLTKDHLRQEEITIALRKALHCEQLMVVFDEYKSKTLLNYFLENKKS